MELKQLLETLSSAAGIPGFEFLGRETLSSAAGFFDEYTSDSVGNHVFIRRMNRSDENQKVPSLMIDAHFDEIGAIVTNVSDDGFLSICQAGGLDRRTLPACDVNIYSANGSKIFGVIGSTPPHLSKGDPKKVPEIEDLRIDTGYSKKELDEMGIGIGSAVNFHSPFTELQNNFAAGKAFDDRSCAAAALYAAASVEKSDLQCDVYVCLSAKEETGTNGAHLYAFRLKPDFAIVTDVNFAAAPDVPAHKSGKCGEGAMLSLSAVTDRSLTSKIIEAAEKAGIPHQTVVEARDTGTNADDLMLVECGIPTAVVSIPIRNMHTYSEVLKISDVEAVSDLFKAVMTNQEICRSFISDPDSNLI